MAGVIGISRHHNKKKTKQEVEALHNEVPEVVEEESSGLWGKSKKKSKKSKK